MCEFCANPFGPPGGNQDAVHHEFAGFFSDSAIEAALQQSQAISRASRNGQGDDEDAEGDEDDDGTNSGFAATTSWLFPTALRLPSGDRHDPVDARALPPSSSAAAAAAIWGRLATRLQVGTLSDPDRHSSVLVPDMSEEYDFPASSAIRITPTPMPDLATLYDMPQSLHPYYRPLNIFATLGLWLVSACTSLLSMISMDRWRAIASGIVVPFAKNILGACSSIIKESLQIKGWRMMLRFFIQVSSTIHNTM
eukprot:CAMPEP_0198109898 /NCGR_PEP_ID=MMETSP1442-20131203/1937_1 /TAXON_ID= /ORGANISM="Craspedostauros australis, Strain CCMP3328" /LENGTH=251 /DNA_ID=CAMNT_0043765739 /DNA_START=84 /DNA_END=840 /DNA_ORIENTATION=+